MMLFKLADNMTNIRERITQADNPNIPNLSPGASQLLTAVMSDDVSLKELIQLLEQYPVITARLISLANSAWSAPQDDIVGLESACTRLGLGVVRASAVALTVRSPFNQLQSTSFDVVRFWSSALIMANVIEKISTFFNVDPQLARTVGLLRHLGLLWLIDESIEDVNSALACIEQDPEKSLDQTLTSLCGIGYIEATAYLFRAWDLPEALIMAVELQADQNDPLVRLLDLAWVCTQSLYEGINVNSIHLPDSTEVSSDYLYDIYDKLSAEAMSTKGLARSLFS